ncbi:MAG: DNA repair protein RecO [Bacteroidota bacterium]|jgi:DNA repair protein RecO (recombination protein O)
MIVETEAVVLHSLHYSDSSKIVTLYTRKYGKIKIIAKGARNQKNNKFGSSLEPMSIISVVVYKNEGKNLHLLSKSEIVTPLNRLQDGAEKMFTGLSLVELVNMVMHDEEENGPLFELLVEALTTIDESSKNSLNVLISFLVLLFQHFGFELNVESCYRCKRKTGQEVFVFGLLRLSDGKFTCSSCHEEEQQSGVKLSGGILKSLYYFQRNPVGKSVMLSLNPVMRDDLLAVLQSYLQYHIDSVRTLRSLSLLQSMGTQ